MLIDTASQLESCCDDLAEAEWVTLDTEFMRERTYYPQLCLIQIGTANNFYCIDALADIQLDRVLQLLCQHPGTRVLHAARQDLEIFFHLLDEVTSPVFDSQIAAGLLGLDAQIGYAGLVKNLVGKELEKGHQRANWANRPLPAGQLEYALDDVRYLSEIYPILLERLDQVGRLHWASEDNSHLLDRNLYVTDPAQAFRRIGQARSLAAQDQHIVRALAQWREQVAQQSDKPRNWVVNDATLIYLAHTKPDSLDRLQKVKGIASELVDRHSETILSAIAAGYENDSEALMSQATPLSEAEQKRYKRLKQRLEQHATNLGINAPVLGTRKDVEWLLRENPKSALLSGWRKAEIGEELLTIS